MGSLQPAVQLVRCDSVGLALPRVPYTPHNIGDLPPYCDLGEKPELIDVIVLRISPKGIFDLRMS
jgi:hypothetical protein